MPSGLSQLSFMLNACLHQHNSHISDLCLIAALKSCYDRFASMFSCASCIEVVADISMKAPVNFAVNCT